MFYINQTFYTLPEQELRKEICTSFYTTLGEQKIADFLTNHSKEFPRAQSFLITMLNIVGAYDTALETVLQIS